MSEIALNAGASELYRAFWRWHFYAGLLVLPVLMLMALTGGLYLFNDEIDALTDRRHAVVAERPVASAPAAWVATAERELGGKVVKITLPAEPGRAVRMVVESGGVKRNAFVDPHDARLVGSTGADGLTHTIKELHSLALIGKPANILVEIVAGWAIVMVATGIFLWWPRGQAGGVVTVRGGPARRVFWRDLHAVTGILASGLILFLATTGMPWSAVWGDQVREITTKAGLGRPPVPSAAAAGGHDNHAPAPAEASDAVPWALQETHVHAGHMMAPPNLGRVIAGIDAAGLGEPYVISIPQEPGKAWSAAHMPDKVEGMRTLYVDGSTGQVIGDIGYRQFGAAAQVIEWGISVHQGQQFGRVNQFLMLSGCVAIWLMGISALVMWWKRRPKGRLGAPPAPVGRRAYLGLAAVVVPLGLIYPLVGASLLVVLGLDILVRRLALRRRPATAT